MYLSWYTMATLAQQSLYALVMSGAEIDHNDPVIRDQLFGVQITREDHVRRIRKLRVDINQAKTKAQGYSNFNNISKANYYIINQICR